MTTQGCNEGGTDRAGERPGGKLQRSCILSQLPGGWGSAGCSSHATLPFPTSLDSAIKCVLKAAAPGAVGQLQEEESQPQPDPGQPLPHHWIG